MQLLGLFIKLCKRHFLEFTVYRAWSTRVLQTTWQVFGLNSLAFDL